MPRVIRLDLPIPPSVNAAYVNAPKGQGGRGRFKSKVYKSWLTAASWELVLQKPKSLPDGPYKVSIAMRRPNKLSDVANREKLLTDFLVTRRVVPDDRYTQEITLRWDDSVVSGRAIVVVESVE
jgi:Holliday junction resolvase RusA-like endonuclease